MQGDVAALIPAYDAAGSVGTVVSDTRARIEAVIVVDDGSRDRTGDAAAAAGAIVLRHPTNLGKGAALLTGLRHLRERGFERALTLDADGQHLAEEIPALLAASAQAPQAIVVGVRQKSGHTIKRSARFGNWVADRLLRTIAGRALPDTQSGFRVYPIDATLALEARGARFDFETEILLRAARRGVDVVGVPVRVHYPPVAERLSHYRPWQDTARIVATVLRVLCRSR